VTARDLAAEIAVWLDEHGQGTAREIAAGVRRRTVDVLDVLRADSRFDGPTERSDRRLSYSLKPADSHGDGKRRASVPSGSQRRQPGRGTDCARLLDVLSDGLPHPARAELYHLGMIVHSRAADLRAMGHDVRCHRGDDGDYYYLLVDSGGPLISGAEGIPGALLVARRRTGSVHRSRGGRSRQR
jgi:hypothetical protein